MNPDSKVFVAGAQGLVGSAISRNLEAKNYRHIYWVRKKNCDLRDRKQVDDYFKMEVLGECEIGESSICYFRCSGLNTHQCPKEYFLWSSNSSYHRSLRQSVK